MPQDEGSDERMGGEEGVRPLLCRKRGQVEEGRREEKKGITCMPSLARLSVFDMLTIRQSTQCKHFFKKSFLQGPRGMPAFRFPLWRRRSGNASNAADDSSVSSGQRGMAESHGFKNIF